MAHWDWNTLGFVVYPYISLTILVCGCLYRYFKDPYSWNARSSEILEKESLKYSSVLFHYGIILALLGHVGGLLVPQRVYSAIGFTPEYHLFVARYSGILFGVAAFAGLLALTWRRLGKTRIRKTSSLGDLITLLLLLIVIGLGTYNVTFAPHKNVLYDVAPWLRGLLTLAPDNQLLVTVPVLYKLHFLAVFTLLAFYPFSRLVHITSAPLTYAYRVYLLFRRRCEGF
ncbi:MAG: respiratory nitrate reductase subunit gamma [Deltaproteobacteria bacterium]|nr:respiratory nitrate reductase subunit gamma [Deltaproteobacteria bacterium]